VIICPAYLASPIIEKGLWGSEGEAIAMDREELLEWIRLGPIRITMNSGDTVDILNRELVMVSSIAAVVLVRCEDGMYRNKVYPLVTMSKIEQLEPAS
jgi:voltage-gated potassium channel Kch